MSYRSVDVSQLAAVEPADQAAPMLEWVPIAKLLIDDAYQRPLEQRNWAAIRKIAGAFAWANFTPVLLAPVESGMFAIIDGQHRCHAAAICGFKSVPAMVVLLPRADQARAFVQVNSGVVAISQYHVLRAALAAGEKWALRCDTAVTLAGCRLMTFHGSAQNRKPGEIYALRMVQRLVMAGKADVLRAVLTAVRAYDVTGRAALYSDYILSPLLTAVASDPAFLRVDLVRFLQAHDPFRLLDRVARMMVNEKLTGSKTGYQVAAFTAQLRAFASASAVAA